MDISEIIHAKEVLKAKREELLKHYVNEYGYWYKPYIVHRSKKTGYIFESKPWQTIAFLQKHHEPVPSNLLEEDAIYCRLRDESIAKMEVKIVNFLYETCKTTKTYTEIYEEKEKISRIRIASLSSAEASEYEDESVSIESRESYYDFREKIIATYEEHGIILPSDQDKLDYIINEISYIKGAQKYTMVADNPWAQRIRRELYASTGLEVSNSDLVNTLYKPNQLACCKSLIVDGKTYTYVYVPLIANIDKDINGIFYHENRHAIESGPNGVAFASRNHSFQYRYINELRTEARSIKDLEALGPLFPSFERESCSAYRPLLEPLYNDFDVKYSRFLDRCAITNRDDHLERAFGRENLTNYEALIYDTLELSLTGEITPKSISSTKTLLSKMERRATTHGIMKQKVKK